MREDGGRIRPWSTGDLAFMRANASLGAAQLARLMNRSKGAVEKAASRHGISLRRPGERRGLVLRQPRGVSLRVELRDDLLDSNFAAAVAARMAIDREADLCPRCVARPITVRATGLCRTCHVHVLTEAHREQTAEIEAQRALWQSRQELKRARDRANVEASSSTKAHVGEC